MSFEINSFIIQFVFCLVVFFLFSYFFYRLHLNSPLHSMAINLWYAFLTSLMSVLFLDFTNVYITEIDGFSQNNITWLPYIFLNVCIFLGFWFGLKVFKVVKPNFNIYRNFEAISSIFLLTLIVIIYAINLILSDALPGLSDDIRRYDYWERASAFPMLPNIFGVVVFFFPITVITLIFYFMKIRSNRIVCFLMIIYLFLYFVYLFLTGQKFNGFMLPFLTIYAVLMCVSGPLQLNLSMTKVRKFGIIFATIFLSIGIIDLIGRGYAEQLNTTGAALYRILVLQGSTFWGIYNSYLESGVQEEDIFDVLTAGSDLIKYIVMPTGSAESYIENGINLSANITGYLFIFFGITGAVVLSLVYGLLLSLICVELVNNIIMFRFFEVIILSMIWLSIIGCYSRGSLENIFALKTLVMLFAIVMIKLMRRI